MKDILTQGLAQMGLSPPPTAVDKLCRYAEMLLEQNQVMNLTAITQPDQVAQLHFLDSAAVTLWRDSGWLDGKSVIDVGTGAGFPGMVLKLLMPSLSLTLADSLEKRIRWLRTVCEALSLDDVRCVHARAEELALESGYRDSFDVVTSRAVASFPLLCELCLPYARVGGVFLALKSVGSDQEVEVGGNAVQRLGGKLLPAFDYTIPGTEISHRIIAVEKISPTPKEYPRSWARMKKAAL